jgi:hypothetical protein
VPLLTTATDRHSRQLCRTDAFEIPRTIPRTAAKATSVVGGQRTGDLVRAMLPAPSATAGTFVGRLAVRATGSCLVFTPSSVVQGIPVRSYRPRQRGDGSGKQKGEAALPPRA